MRLLQPARGDHAAEIERASQTTSHSDGCMRGICVHVMSPYEVTSPSEKVSRQEGRTPRTSTESREPGVRKR